MGGLSDPSWPDRRLDYHVEAVISNMGKQEVGWLMVKITGGASGLTVTVLPQSLHQAKNNPVPLFPLLYTICQLFIKEPYIFV